MDLCSLSLDGSLRRAIPAAYVPHRRHASHPYCTRLTQRPSDHRSNKRSNCSDGFRNSISDRPDEVPISPKRCKSACDYRSSRCRPCAGCSQLWHREDWTQFRRPPRHQSDHGDIASQVDKMRGEMPFDVGLSGHTVYAGVIRHAPCSIDWVCHAPMHIHSDRFDHHPFIFVGIPSFWWTVLWNGRRKSTL